MKKWVLIPLAVALTFTHVARPTIKPGPLVVGILVCYMTVKIYKQLKAEAEVNPIDQEQAQHKQLRL